MNDLNKQLMDSLNDTYHVLRRRTARGILSSAGYAPHHHEALLSRGHLMDRRKLMQLKEQYALLQRENMIREAAAILRTRQNGTEEPSVSEKHLLSYLKDDPEQLSSTLAQLEREGYFRRIRSLTDRKESRFTLTEKGWQHAMELKAIKDQQNAEFLKPLTADEKETLLQLLEKLKIAHELGFTES